MKQIYTLLAATLMLAGTALWSGCSDSETLLDNTDGIVTPAQQAAGFSFSLKGLKADTRATVDELTTKEEKEVKTLYIAFFLKNGDANESNYPLHRIFAYDQSITYSDDPSSLWKTNTEIKEVNGDFKIENPGTVGDYVAYFIANPDAEMVKTFEEFQGTVPNNPTKLSDFEKLKTQSGAAVGTADGTKNGFVMLAKENITLSNAPTTTHTITLNRLAARFDFINSAASTGKVEITSIKILNAPQVSRLMEKADPSNEELQTQEVDISSWKPTTAAEHLTAYTYENLNLGGGNQKNRLSIEISYKLKSGAEGEGTAMTKTINLQEGGNDLPVKRNHMYRIFMNGITGQFSLQVLDWNEGATVTVPDESLGITFTEQDLGKIGDYIYTTGDNKLAFSDGGLRRMNFDGSMVWEKERPAVKTDLGTCVGIVFSYITSEKDKAQGWTGYAFGIEHTEMEALLISSKDPNTGLEGELLPTMFSYYGPALQHLDGYMDTERLRIADSASPAIEYVDSYAKQYPLPDQGTSGWYIPSLGQMFSIATIAANSPRRDIFTAAASKDVNSAYQMPGDFPHERLDWLLEKIPAKNESNKQQYEFGINRFHTSTFTRNNSSFTFIFHPSYPNSAAACPYKFIIQSALLPVFAFSMPE